MASAYDRVVGTWRMLAGPKGLTPTQSAYWEGVMTRLAQTDACENDLQRHVFEPDFMEREETRPYRGPIRPVPCVLTSSV